MIQPIPPSDHTSLMFGNFRGSGLTIRFTAERAAWVKAAAISTIGTLPSRVTCGSAPPMCMQMGSSASSQSANSGSQ